VRAAVRPNRWLRCASKLTLAPYGGSRSSTALICAVARGASSRGGKRSDNFRRVSGRITLPAFAIAGSPSAPVTASAGRQVAIQDQLGVVVQRGNDARLHRKLTPDLVAQHFGRAPRLLDALGRDRRLQVLEFDHAGASVLQAI